MPGWDSGRWPKSGSDDCASTCTCTCCGRSSGSRSTSSHRTSDPTAPGRQRRTRSALLGILVWPISSYWFIYSLFVFTLVLWLFRKAPQWVLLSIALVLSILSSSGILDANNVGINRMTEYLIFFTIGAYFNRRIFASVDTMRPWKATALAGRVRGVRADGDADPGALRIPGTAFVGQVLAIATGFALAFYLVHLTFFKWVVYVGLRTLNIYLVHVFVIAVLVFPLTFLPCARQPARTRSAPDRGHRDPRHR